MYSDVPADVFRCKNQIFISVPRYNNHISSAVAVVTPLRNKLNTNMHLW